MATEYISKKLSTHIAEQFAESFSEPEPTSIGYVFVGNHVPYASESFPDSIVETPSSEKQVWDNIIAAKKITGADTSLVIPIKRWISGIYTQYDDLIDTSSLSLSSFYVMNSNNQVYKCLSNDNGDTSVNEPTGDYSINNGIIQTNDGYIWKYMYTYPSTNKFVTDSYAPVPLKANSSGYSTSTSSIVDGGIYSIVITNSGGSRYNTFVTTATFVSATNIVSVVSADGIANNMLVTGTGIQSNTLVSLVSGTNITLSKNTTSSGGTLTFSPRAVIIGDGTGAEATIFTSGSPTNSISKIVLTNFGSGYSYANVTIYAKSSSVANTRVIIGPKYGHGYYPAKELYANSVMISVKIGESDTTEGGLISDSTTIRQYGFLRDPCAYGSVNPVNSLTANLFVSQVYTLTVTGESPYTLNEFAYQGADSANATFSGYVNSQTTNTVKLTKVKGVFKLGSPLKGQTSLIARNVIDIAYPSLQPYSGDILYANNIQYIQRTTGQTENFNFVLRF